MDNFTHALDCLKALLILLQEAESGTDEDEEMSSAYLMLNLGSAESIKWGLSLNGGLRRRRSPLISSSLRCNFCLLERNYARLFRTVRTLPTTALLAFLWNMPTILRCVSVGADLSLLCYTHDMRCLLSIRMGSSSNCRDILTVMSSAYNSKVLTFPSDEFSKLFCLDQGEAS